MSERCPRCGEPLAAGARWCMSCGSALRTRLAPVPRVALLAPLGLLLALVLLAAVAFAIVSLSGGGAAGAGAPHGATGASGASGLR